MSVSTSTVSNKTDNNSSTQNSKLETKYSVSSYLQFAGRHITLLAQCPNHPFLVRSKMKALVGSSATSTAASKLSLQKEYEDFILRSPFLLYGKCDMGKGVEALVGCMKACLEKTKVKSTEQLIKLHGLDPKEAKELSTWPEENRALIAVIIELAGAALTPEQQRAFKAIEKLDNFIDSGILISETYSWLWLAEQEWKKKGTAAKVERNFHEVLQTSLKEIFAAIDPKDAEFLQTEAMTRLKMDQVAWDALFAIKRNPTPETLQNMEIALIVFCAFGLKKAIFQESQIRAKPSSTSANNSAPAASPASESIAPLVQTAAKVNTTAAPTSSPLPIPSRKPSPFNPLKVVATTASAPLKVAATPITATKNTMQAPPATKTSTPPAKPVEQIPPGGIPVIFEIKSKNIEYPGYRYPVNTLDLSRAVKMAPNNTPIKIKPTDDQIEGFFSSDGKTLYVSDYSSGLMLLKEIVSGKMTSQTTKGPQKITQIPESMYVAPKDYILYVVNLK